MSLRSRRGQLFGLEVRIGLVQALPLSLPLGFSARPECSCLFEGSRRLLGILHVISTLTQRYAKVRGIRHLTVFALRRT